MKKFIKMDDLGVPLFFGNTHLDVPLEISKWLGPVGYFTLAKNPFISRLKPIDPSHLILTFRDIQVGVTVLGIFVGNGDT